MLPEIRTFVERAIAHRQLLDDLLDVIPDEYWLRRAIGEDWNARNHLEHVATADDLLDGDLERVIAGSPQIWLGGNADAAVLGELRRGAIDAVADESIRGLREQMARGRERTLASLGQLRSVHLETAVFVPGLMTAWGEPFRLPLREYLAAWPSHDSEHEAAIRRAITSPPDLSAVALTRRKRS
ncbi:MAG: DinB family protein [Tepidiformaceae bacterium]